MASTETSESSATAASTIGDLASFQAKRGRWMSSPRKKLIPLPPPSPKIVPPPSFGSPITATFQSPSSGIRSPFSTASSEQSTSADNHPVMSMSSNLFGGAPLAAGSPATSTFGRTPPKPTTTTFGGSSSSHFSKTSNPFASSVPAFQSTMSSQSTPTMQPLVKPASSSSSLSSAFPPSSTKAPTPFSASMKSESPAPAAGFPPLSSKAPTPFRQMKASSPVVAPSASFPPSSSKAPNSFDQLKASSLAAAPAPSFPPSSSKAATPFGQVKAPSPASAPNAGFPPSSSMAPTPFSASSKIHSKDQDYKARLVEFYKKHNPSKVNIVDATLVKYKGNEEELFLKLQAKYENSAAAPPSPFPQPSGEGPLCFIDFSVDGETVGRVIVKVYADKTPLAADNFKCLCTGEKGMGRLGKPLCYKDSKVHRIVPNFCVQMGDFTKGNGTGGESIYPPNSEHGDAWGKFKDESFMQHSKKGLLSMANSGKNTNSSQVFFTLRPVPYLDGKHVVFGEVKEGMDVIERLGKVVTNSKQNPTKAVVISQCGEVKEGQAIPSTEPKQNATFGNSSGASPFAAPVSAFGTTGTSTFGATTNSSFSFGGTSAKQSPFSFGNTSGTPAFGALADNGSFSFGKK